MGTSSNFQRERERIMSVDSDFSPRFRHVHSQLSGDDYSLAEFAHLIRPEACNLVSKADFYAPLQLRVKVSGETHESGGVLLLEVPVRESPNWYPKLQERLAVTMGLPVASAAHVDVRDVQGRSIKTMTANALLHVGQLNVALKDKRKRLKTMPEPPAEYSPTKTADIANWLNGATRDLPAILSEILVDKNTAGVNSAIMRDGEVQDAIMKHLAEYTSVHHLGSSNKGWNEFVRVSSRSSPTKQNTKQAQRVLQVVSRTILHYVRAFIGASSERVGKYIAARQARNMAEHMAKTRFKTDKGQLGGGGADNADLFAPVLGTNAKVTGYQHVTADSGYTMYSELMETALETPTLSRDIISTLYERRSDHQQQQQIGCGAHRDNYYDSASDEGNSDDDDAEYSYYNRGGDDEDDDDYYRTGRGGGGRGGKFNRNERNGRDRPFTHRSYHAAAPRYYQDEASKIGNPRSTLYGREQVLVLEPREWVETISGEHTHKCPAWKHKHHHPYWTNMHSFYEPMWGRYPTYYNSHHTKQDLSASAPYPGDPRAAHVASHVFMGKHVVPPGLKLGPKKKLSLAAATTATMVKGRQVLGGDMPKLVPIPSEQRGMPKLVPIAREPRGMPKLVPIPSEQRGMPKVTRASKAPPVRYVGSAAAAGRVTRSTKPRVIPLRKSPIRGPLHVEEEEEDFGMASVADVFGKHRK
jgi:hypothetical protein